MKIRRALISVFDKTGILPLAKGLNALGVEIISTGGTADLLKKEGIPVREVAEITQFPEMLGGRVKTLHPNIHAGLLAKRDDSTHLETLSKHNIKPIDLLVVNLYPFWDAVKNHTEEAKIIEMIDIGGPSMLRSAAKNFRGVAAVSDPSDYPEILSELKKSGGVLSDETRRRLASKVFETTAKYDAMIHSYFAGSNGSPPISGASADLTLEFVKETDLRYGENPHQKAALYRDRKGRGGIVNAKKKHGKELSFNNILDLDAAYEMASAFNDPSCAIVKHTSPCGFAIGKTSLEAFKKAHACDPVSAFGGIIGFNKTVDGKTAQAILDSGFVECVIAASFEDKALELLKTKKNLRLLELKGKSFSAAEQDFKKVSGGLLLQDRDAREVTQADLKIVTKKKPTKTQIDDLLFAFRVCRYVKSNAIVIAKGGATLGLGMGQPSRVDSCFTAFRKAGKKSKGAVLASDGFFPKPDSIALAKRNGITAIIQPGGSIQDEPVIQACNKAGMAMVFTGVRHFRH